jgi:hypothetical protein
VLSEVNHIAVLVALHAAAVVPAAQVQLHARRAARQGRVGSTLEKAVHSSALVGLEVQQDHIRKPPRVQHLSDGAADVVVHRVHPGVDERRALVVDQELVELEVQAIEVKRGRDPVDPIHDLVDPRHGRLLLAMPTWTMLRRMAGGFHRESTPRKPGRIRTTAAAATVGSPWRAGGAGCCCGVEAERGRARTAGTAEATFGPAAPFKPLKQSAPGGAPSAQFCDSPAASSAAASS